MSLSAGSLYDYITPADSCRRGRRRSTEWAGEQPAVVVVDGVSPVKRKRARWATTGRRRRATASGSSSGSRWTFSGRPTRQLSLSAADNLGGITAQSCDYFTPCIDGSVGC